MVPERFNISARAPALGMYPNFLITPLIFSFNSELTESGLFRALETVAVDTFAAVAT